MKGYTSIEILGIITDTFNGFYLVFRVFLIESIASIPSGRHKRLIALHVWVSRRRRQGPETLSGLLGRADIVTDRIWSRAQKHC